MFQGPKRQRNHLEIYGRQYLEGRRTTEKGSKQTEARGPKEGAHVATVPGRVGPTHLALEAPLPLIFAPPTSS